MRGFEPKKKWQRRDLNLRPRAYESPALPLSYAARLKMYHKLNYVSIASRGSVCFWLTHFINAY